MHKLHMFKRLQYSERAEPRTRPRGIGFPERTVVEIDVDLSAVHTVYRARGGDKIASTYTSMGQATW